MMLISFSKIYQFTGNVSCQFSDGFGQLKAALPGWNLP